MENEKQTPRELESDYRIQFSDCDPFGHLNNARYIEYFYNARVEQVREQLDFDIYEIARQEKKSWVVSLSQIAYFYPVEYNEIVTIKTRMIELTPYKVTAEYIMSNRKNHKLHSILWSGFTFIDLATGRPTRHPDKMHAFFETILYKDENINLNDFNNRTKTVSREYKKLA